MTVRTSASTVAGAAVDLVLRHPVATLAILGTRLLGWPVRRCLPTAVALDQLVPFAVARHPAPLARFLRLWTLACRFHRRWPSSLTQAEAALGRQVSVASATTRTADDGTPPWSSTRRSAPALARLPHRIEGTTVAWAIDLDPGIDPAGLGRDAARLSLLDPHLLRVDVARRSDDWEVVVDFDVEPPTLAVSRTGEEHVFASTDASTIQHRQHEEGRAHGNG